MKIGLIGSGGREHALALQLARNSQRDSLYIYGSHHNPGIDRLAKQVTVGSMKDQDSILSYMLSNGVDLVVIGPEAPLISGVVDLLRSRGIPTLGPTRAQAALEGDKTFMRRLLERRIGWGSPLWKQATSLQEAEEFIHRIGPVAVKPLGLTGGKGVRLMGVHLKDAQAAIADAETWIRKEGSVLLEELLVGEEFSRMAFVSGGRVTPMPVAQDFKYAFDGDQGNMTGGMGSYTTLDGSLPFLRPEDLEQADRMLVEVVTALQAETGESYCGFLYGQFMATARGVRVIEFNVRLGDPEGINVMLLLESDVPQLFLSIAQGNMAASQVHFARKASVVKYLVPCDYPDNSPHPVIFQLVESPVEQAGLQLVTASVEGQGKSWRTLGSRTLALAGLGEEPGEVSQRIETYLLENEPPGLRHRCDVGDSRVIQAKVERMSRLRSGLRPSKIGGGLA